MFTYYYYYRKGAIANCYYGGSIIVDTDSIGKKEVPTIDTTRRAGGARVRLLDIVDASRLRTLLSRSTSMYLRYST